MTDRERKHEQDKLQWMLEHKLTLKTLINGLDQLKEALQILLQEGLITYEGIRHISFFRDILIRSPIFTREEFTIPVDCYEWEKCPSETVVKTLAELLVCGNISFRIKETTSSTD